MRRLLIALALATSSLVVLGAQRGGVLPQDPIALVNASVVNVRTGAVLHKATVVLRGGTIASVGTGAAPAGVRAIDLRGRYVVPGLIDAHVHIASLPQLRRAGERRDHGA